jgi:hypothetical protein
MSSNILIRINLNTIIKNLKHNALSFFNVLPAIPHLQPEPTINRHQIVEIIMTLPTIIINRTKITYQANPDGTITFVKSIPEATTNAQNHKEYK